MKNCTKNLATGLHLVGAPSDIREFLERGGTVVIPCPMCAFGERTAHLLKVSLPFGGQYKVEEIIENGKDHVATEIS